MIHHINKYGSQANWIFIHGLSVPLYCLIFIKPWYDKKIIWRTWGHDICMPTKAKATVKQLLKMLLLVLCKKRVKRFKLVGLANIVDELKVKLVFGSDVVTANVPYGLSERECKKRNDVLHSLVSDYKKTDDVCRIMIGHSAYPIDNHVGMINKVKRFMNENIRVYVMLPYGQKDYAEAVKEYALHTLGDKCVIVDRRKPLEEFFSFLLTMDIAILDMQDSAALGILSYLVLAHKKVFLRKDGDIHRAFDYCGLPCGLTDDLDSISYDTFSSPIEYDTEKALLALNPALLNAGYSSDAWNYIFEELLIK